MPDRRADPRAVVLDLLAAVEERSAYANLSLPRLIRDAGLDARDAALATELGYGTLRAAGVLDTFLERCVDRPLDRLDPPVLRLLRLGAYQALRTRIPPHAAVATTVDLARAGGHGRAAGLVNAVLRRVVVADWDEWSARVTAGRPVIERLAMRYAHPSWLASAFAQALGEQPSASSTSELTETARALAADDERPITHLVARPGRVTRAELLAQSDGAPGPWSPYAVRLEHGGDPARIAAVRSGAAAVQDEGSQLCALALAEAPLAGPDAAWLDLCAGPGGKAALLAALAAARGARVHANELHPHRAELVAAATAGAPVDITVGDARELPGDGRYDRVLLDAPCTGTGALRRRPEARWRRDPSDLAALTGLQRELLAAALRLVRPGGVVGYVTCSPHLAETRDVVAGTRPSIVLDDARPLFAALPELGAGPTVQLWPHRHGTDAMFFALLRRAG